MSIWSWIGHNAFDLVTGIGVIGGLFFSLVSRRDATRSQQTANLLSITANHRELWRIFLETPELRRVREKTANIQELGITEQERVFVNLVIQHCQSVYRAMDAHLLINIEGLQNDISQFFAFPVVERVWEKIRAMQNGDFVAFVEACRKTENGIGK